MRKRLEREGRELGSISGGNEVESKIKQAAGHTENFPAGLSRNKVASSLPRNYSSAQHHNQHQSHPNTSAGDVR